MPVVRVVGSAQGHRLDGDGAVVGAGNRFLEHLVTRRFSPATVRAYAFDLANFGRFFVEVATERTVIAAVGHAEFAHFTGSILGVALTMIEGPASNLRDSSLSV